MSLTRQILLSLLVAGAALATWIAYVPSAMPWLERAGVLDLMGIEPPEAEQAPGRGGFGRGGPAQVVAAEVELRALNDRISAIGDGRALRAVTVRSEVAGRIASLDVASGQYVEGGAVILRLEDAAERIAVEKARLTLADAEDEMARIAALTDTGAVTAVRKREAELALATARLVLRQAEFDLDQKVIRAPIPGWLGLIAVEQGDRITAQDSIAVLADRSRILVDFRVPERIVGQLSPGQAFRAAPLALEGAELVGRIVAVDNIVDRASRTLRVQGELDNSDDALRAGMAFSVSMSFPGSDYPSVPPLAVQWSSEGAFVWAVREGKAARVPVTIRQRNADSVLVEADLAAGDLVVVEGVQSLRPGAEVRLAPQTAGGPPPAGGAGLARL